MSAAFNTSIFFLVVIFLDAVTVLAIFLTSFSTKRSDTISTYPADRENLLLSIGFGIPVTIEIAMTAIKSVRLCSDDASVDFSVLARCLLLLSLQLSDTGMFIWTDHNRVDVEKFAWVKTNILSFKLVAVVGCIAAIISNQTKSTLQNNQSIVSTSRQLTLLFVTALLFQAFCLSDFDTRTVTWDVHSAILFLATVQGLLLCLSCSYNVSYKFTKREVIMTDLREDIVVGMCLVMLLLMLASSSASVMLKSSSIAQYSQLVVNIGVVVVPWRLHEWLSDETVKTTLKESSSFLRYIAHEVRAALNVTQLSLSVSTQDIQNLSSSKYQGELTGAIDAITDADDSCKSAISILNDVLIFDKMKGGYFLAHSICHFVISYFALSQVVRWR